MQGVFHSLSPRLAALAALVRQGALFADIGSDHGYLPLFLLREGVVERAVATDLREGPLRSARAHLEAEDPSLASRLTLLRADGLSGLDGYILPHLQSGVCDIAIAGMGGELIASILHKAPFVRHPAVRLLLQPMTRPEAVRRFLEEKAFCIEQEVLAREDGRIYQIFAAGVPKSGGKDESVSLPPMTALEALVGRRTFWKGPDDAQNALRLLLFEKLRSRTAHALAGKRKGGRSCVSEEALLTELDGAITELKRDVPAANFPKGAAHDRQSAV